MNRCQSCGGEVKTEGCARCRAALTTTDVKLEPSLREVLSKLAWKVACVTVADHCKHEDVGEISELPESLRGAWCPCCGAVKIGEHWLEPYWLLQYRAGSKP